ncbi:hypothetical protein K402DRAFT_407851 [Aulographum hederae CBS 113979]|uniref:Hamartin-domain-containing protein n=1 Tax=Aulographum hederae CBS 113979 TaxID=1176131 RepID=A0A6G1GN90_9PEZI|nr:hypothetical protein K402DRAFT_407851 [Aulographum hederae CBS 113979]
MVPLKDAVKAVTQAFAVPSVQHPLPDDLQRTIETFLHSHNPIDESDSQKLHEELLSVYNKSVLESPEKHGPFVSVLRLLRPAITGQSRLDEWWMLAIKPTIDAVGHRRDTIEDAREFLLGIMTFDPEEDHSGERSKTSTHFTTKLIDAYLARTRIPSGTEEAVSPEDDFIAHELEAILVAFGRKMPEEFLLAIDRVFILKKYRAQALGLLSAYVRFQPPHLHLVLQTPLIDHLQSCLLIDTSSTIVDLALTILIMFLPHITSCLTSNLPKLFLIYSRILCWDRYRNELQVSSTHSSGIMDQYIAMAQEKFEPLVVDPSWEKLHQSFDQTASPPPRVDYFFTFLYGLFPLNFMSYVRKPRKYLKAAEYPGTDGLDLNQELIRTRTEDHRRVHLLHPNFFTTTVEDELSENRWLRSDPADLVAECLDLCVAVSATLDDPGPPPTAKLPPLPKSSNRSAAVPSDALLVDDDATLNNDPSSPTDVRSNNSWRNTQSTSLTSPSIAGHVEPSALRPKASQASFGNPSSRSSGQHSLVQGHSPDSPTIPSQGSQASGDEKHSDSGRKPSSPSRRAVSKLGLVSGNLQFPLPPKQAGTEPHSRASLQRELILLRNDLNFERYLKQQHLAHIGQLQRRRMGEATVEAETQNLINTNKHLKAKLAKLNEQYAQLKKESTTSRNQSKRWETELSAKVRSYREDEKHWQGDEKALRMDYERVKNECDQLRRLVVESEHREDLAKNRLRSLETDLKDLEGLRREVTEVEARLREFELREMEIEKASRNHEKLQNELKITKMNLSSRDGDWDRVKAGYDRRIAELEGQLQSSPHNANFSSGQLPPSVQQMLDSALAASSSKLLQLKKTHTRLLHKYTELELRYQEVVGEREAAAGNTNGTDSADSDLPKDESASVNFSRNNSLSAKSARSAGGYRSSGRPHPFSEPLLDGDTFTQGPRRDHVNEADRTGPNSNSYPGRPTRFESLQHRFGERPVSHDHDLSATYESNPLHPDFHAFNPTAPLSSGDRMGAMSTGSGGSIHDGKDGSKNEFRMYGRGGAQNISKKMKDKKEKSGKSGGIRGIRGFM